MAKVKNTYLTGYKPLNQLNTPFAQTWGIIKWRNIAMIKLVELLHIQLMRKGKSRYHGYYDHPLYGKVYSVAKYNIKSGSKAPYDYYGLYNLGLNQFFVGQSPYAWYSGDPGSSSGIYHDTCEILRSSDNATSTKYKYKDLTLIKKWGQGEMVHSLHPVFNPFKDREYIYRFPVKAKISCTFEWDKIVYLKNFRNREILDENGNKIIDKSQSTIKVIRNVNVDMERWKIKLDGSRQRIADIRDLNFNTTLQATPIYGYQNELDRKGGKDEIITGYNKDIDIFAYLPEFYREFKDSRVYTYDEMIKLIGQTLEWELVLNGDDDFVDIYLWGSYAGRIIAFGDGEVAGYMDDGRILIQGTKLEQHRFTTGSDNEHTHYFYYDIPTLNLIETFDPNTHMPLRGAFKFVTQWQNHYGLHVEEDKETWEKLVPVAVIIIVVVVTIVTWGTATAQVSAAGSAVTAGTTGATAAGATAAGTAGFFSATASALATIGITSVAGTLALSSLFLNALGYGLSYAGAKHGKMGLIKGGQVASFAGAAMGVASIGASINTALSSVTAEAVARSSGCYLSEAALAGGSGAASGTTATGLMVSGTSITTNLGVTTVNSGMGIVSISSANSSVLFVNGVAMSGTGVIGSMAAQFGFSMTTTTQLMSLANIATTTYSIGINLYSAFNSVKDVLSSLRGEPVDPDIPQNQSDEEAIAGGNGAMGVSPSVVMRFERDILPPDLGLDQDSLIYVRSLLKAYIHDKGNLANLADNIIQTRLKKRYAPLIPAME